MSVLQLIKLESDKSGYGVMSWPKKCSEAFLCNPLLPILSSEHLSSSAPTCEGEAENNLRKPGNAKKWLSMQ